MVEFVIRYAKIEDAVKISEIENACFSVPWSQKLIENEILNDNAVFLTAQDTDGLLLGYASGQLVLDIFYISNIAVREDCRRLGIGAELLQQLIDVAWDRGCNEVTLEVRVSNKPARKLYESFGFRLLGERKDYYQKPTENAMIYTLFLDVLEADYEDTCD